MFTAEVPEKLIKSVSGHKSSQALQVYERPTVAQKQAVSRVLTAPPSGCNHGSYLQELQKQLLCSSVQQPTASVQQPTSLPALVQQPTSAEQLGLSSTVQSQHRVTQLDSSSFISSMWP